MTREFRVRSQDRVRITTQSANASKVVVRGLVELDNGNTFTIDFSHTPNSDRTSASTDSAYIPNAGKIVQLFVAFESVATGVKRGLCAAGVFLRAQNGLIYDRLSRGYIYDGGNLTLGDDAEKLDGRGALDWTQEANDAAGNAVTTVNLAATNTRRIVHAVIVKYHQVGGATATITITLRDLADSGGPTNWSIESDTWISPDLVLAADQEGLMHVGEHGFLSTNDAGTLAYADNTTAPNPFPLVVEDGDPADLLIAASGGASGDDYDVWVQYEEWIEV